MPQVSQPARDPWRHPDEAGPLVRALLHEAATHDSGPRPAHRSSGGPAGPTGRSGAHPLHPPLRASAKRLLRSLPSPLLVVAPDGTIIVATDAAAALLGAEGRALEGGRLDDALAPLEVLRASVAPGGRGELRFDRADGQRANLGYRLGPLATAAGYVAVVLDDAPQRRARAAAEAEVADEPFDVTELLQMAAMARKSIALDVSTDAGLAGQVVVRAGAPWSALDRHGEGPAALARLAFQPGARTACRPLTGPLPPRNLHGGVDALLLDAARRHDEAAR